MKYDRLKLKDALLLYAVTDYSSDNSLPLCEQVEQAILGGVTCVQLREKYLSYSDFINEAIAIKPICNTNGVPLIINDNIQVAIESGADGVHIGQHDIPAIEARKMLGDDKILGVSVQTVEQAVKAEKDGADYLGVGAVFPTSTKADADSVTRDTLVKICAAVNIPVVAIGGIQKDNICSLCDSGIVGVALVSAIFSQPDIAEAAREIKIRAKKLDIIDSEALDISRIKGAIFDLDGTLLDSMYIWENVGINYIKSIGKIPHEGLREVLRALSLMQAAEYFVDYYSLDKTPQQICDEINSQLADFYAHIAKAKSGTRRFLERLKAAGIPMCIATATDRPLTESALKNNGIFEYFKKIFTCGEEGDGKDKPKIFNSAYKCLGTELENTYVFEDALFAMQTAKSAGFGIVAVYDVWALPGQAKIAEIADYYIKM